MMLSPKVGEDSVRVRPHGQPPAKKQVSSPFGGMNRTDPGLQVAAERRRRESQITRQRPKQRTTRGRNAGKANVERQPGEMKALKMQRSLGHIPYGHRAQVKSRIDEIKTFGEFPLLPIIQESIPAEALKGMENIGPTPIQRLAIPALLGLGDKKGRRAPQPGPGHGMQQYLLAAETGSGKTLAYLLPTVDAIKRAEAAEAEVASREKAAEERKKGASMFSLEPPPLTNEPHPTTGRPRAIVILPTSELVDQVGRIFKSFSHTAKLRVAMLSASYSATVIRNRLFSPTGVDVVTSTPHLLNSIAETTPNILSRVTHLIIDEADSLFDRSFAPLTSNVLDRATPSLKQLILCSATITRSLDSYLHKRFPDITRLTTPNLHAIPRRVQLSVVDIDKEPYRGHRDLACADTIWSIGRSAAVLDETQAVANIDKTKRVLVFVNEREKAQELAAYLVTKGVDAASMTRDTPEQRSSEILSAFTSTMPLETVSDNRELEEAARGAGKQVTARRILPNTKVLVMTDLGSRGIDTVAVRNVVLYDVPHTTIDFIHRLGRTGRMGRRGRGFVLVGKHDRKDVVREVREGMYRGQALI